MLLMEVASSCLASTIGSIRVCMAFLCLNSRMQLKTPRVLTEDCLLSPSHRTWTMTLRQTSTSSTTMQSSLMKTRQRMDTRLTLTMRDRSRLVEAKSSRRNQCPLSGLHQMIVTKTPLIPRRAVQPSANCSALDKLRKNSLSQRNGSS